MHFETNECIQVLYFGKGSHVPVSRSWKRCWFTNVSENSVRMALFKDFTRVVCVKNRIWLTIRVLLYLGSLVDETSYSRDFVRRV